MISQHIGLRQISILCNLAGHKKTNKNCFFFLKLMQCYISKNKPFSFSQNAMRQAGKIYRDNLVDPLTPFQVIDFSEV